MLLKQSIAIKNYFRVKKSSAAEVIWNSAVENSS